MDKISVDLIHKIFMRIPIKSLLKARCVSKSWREIIDDPFFEHLQYNCGEVEKNTLLLTTSVLSWPEDTTSFYAAECSDDEENRMIRAATVPMVKFQTRSTFTYGSCNGLLYFADADRGQILVSNPLRSQFTILPPTPVKMYCWQSYYSAIGLGFDSSTKTFKMVCTNKPGSTQFTIVHTLGTTSWREVPSVPAIYCGRMDHQSVYVHGFLHWMIDHSHIKNGPGRILAFDVSKETFEEVVPHRKLCFEKHSDRYFRILDFKGNLGMFDLSHGTKFDLCSSIHTLGTTSWRQVPSVPAFYCGRMDHQSVYVHGFLHWMIDHSHIKNGPGRILAFDVSKETFEEVAPHRKLSFEKHSDRYFRILDFKGNLGMFDLSHGTKFDLWVMDYEKKSWSKEYTIDITIVGKIHVDCTNVKGLWKQDEILFEFRPQDYSCRNFVRYWSYSMRTGNIKECEDQGSKAQVFSLKGSLISIPGAMEVS